MPESMSDALNRLVFFGLTVVLRTFSGAISILPSGCIANPETLCRSLVPPGWIRVLPPPGATAALSPKLPRVPYSTNSGHVVREIQTLWFRHSDRFIACTLYKRATDTCSVEILDIEKIDGSWIASGDNAVLCNVLATHSGP
jgi:hypothetical protein